MRNLFLMTFLVSSLTVFGQEFKRGDKLVGKLSNLKNSLVEDEDSTIIKSPETLELRFKLNICFKEEVTMTNIFGNSTSGFACLTDSEKMPLIKDITIPVTSEDIPEIGFEFEYEEIQSLLVKFTEVFAKYNLNIKSDLDNFSLGVEVFEIDHSIFGDDVDEVAETSIIDADRISSGHDKESTHFISGSIDGDLELSVSKAINN